MKKLLSFCAACLVALSGCTPGGGESTAPPPVSPSAGLPSTTPLSSQEVVLTHSPSPDSPAPSVPASAAPPVESASPAPSPTPLPPETPVPETPVPETPVPETPVPETPAWDGNPDALTLDDFPTQLITGPELAAAAAAVPKAPAAAPAAAPVIEDGIPDEVVAAIAAAIASMDGGRYTLRSLTRKKEGRGAWSLAGVVSTTEPF